MNAVFTPLAVGARRGPVGHAGSVGGGLGRDRWQDRRMADSFPRRSARTARFTLGAPRAFQVSADGERVTFLRSSSGTDRAAPTLPLP